MTTFTDEEGYRLAAVLIALVDPKISLEYFYELNADSGSIELSRDAYIILTKRADTLLHHGGQISFPGGVPEFSDADLFETALRESVEEIGLPQNDVRFLGQLAPVSTHTSKFKVSPFVGVLSEVPELKPNPQEIDKILLVPLAHLLNPEFHKMEIYEELSPTVKLPVYYFEDNRIWGATARMIQLFLKNIRMLK